jgi:hypothetical protein
MKFFGALVGIVFFLVVINSLVGVSGNSTAASSRPQASIELNDPRSLDQSFDVEATSRCSTGADDYLRQAGKTTFKWDDINFLESKFDKYLKKTDKPGVLTLVSDRVSLQSGLGAYQRAKLLCEYDTQAGRVLSYKIMGVTR